MTTATVPGGPPRTAPTGPAPRAMPASSGTAPGTPARLQFLITEADCGDPVAGPLWRMAESRFEAIVNAGLLTSADQVVLREGLLCERNAPPADHHVTLWRMPGDRYRAIVQAGLFTPDDRVELLEGVLAAKMSKNQPHVFVARMLAALLARMLDDRPVGTRFVATQDPLDLGDTEPEPDVMVVRGRPADYLTRHPTATDVDVVVEVADSSLRQDREVKGRAYARAGVREFWLVSVPDRCIEVHTHPRTGPDGRPDWGAVATFAAGQVVPVMLDGVRAGEVPVSDILPPTGE